MITIIIIKIMRMAMKIIKIRMVIIVIVMITTITILTVLIVHVATGRLRQHTSSPPPGRPLHTRNSRVSRSNLAFVRLVWRPSL